MDLTIDAKVITKSIGTIRDFVGPKTELGSFLRLDATEDTVDISATDEITYATLSIPKKEFDIDVKTTGSVFVKSESMLKIISLIHPLTNEGTGCSSVEMSDIDKSFTISYSTVFRGGAVVKNDRNIPKDYGNKYPAVASIKTPSFVVDSLDLKRCLRKVHYAVGTEDIERNLNSILIETLPGNRIKFTSTNYFKFSQATLSIAHQVEPDIRIVLPSRVSRKLSRLLESTEEDYPVKFFYDGKSIYVAFENYYLTLRTPSLKTKFPDTSKAFDEKSSDCSVEKRVFVGMVRDILPVAEGDDYRATFDFKEKQCKVFSPGYLGGTSLGLVIPDLAEDVKLDINSQYVLDTIRTMDSETIRVEFFSKRNKIGFYEDCDSIEMKAVVAVLR
jgi:DNA polymerase III sliding clamp (beta) subunit (PCNA family)